MSYTKQRNAIADKSVTATNRALKWLDRNRQYRANHAQEWNVQFFKNMRLMCEAVGIVY